MALGPAGAAALRASDPRETGFGSGGCRLPPPAQPRPHQHQGARGTGPAHPPAPPACLPSLVTFHVTVPARLPTAASSSAAQLPLPDAPSIAFLVPLEFRALWNPSHEARAPISEARLPRGPAQLDCIFPSSHSSPHRQGGKGDRAALARNPPPWANALGSPCKVTKERDHQPDI